MIVVLMGVAGAGKTAVGRRLAARLGWAFHDGDDLHPEANVRKMADGRPLTAEDRRPWLAAIRALLVGLASAGTDAVVACSALTAESRRTLLSDLREARLVYLRGAPELIAERLRRRRGHFFPPELLASQLATLEEPESALVVDVDADLDVVVSRVLTALGLPSRRTAGGD
jgi:carbohydrate kinase (thermoresistant glucokinase family)